ncbi:hypothetical protein ES703_81268 [subsurface metagenome]
MAEFIRSNILDAHTMATEVVPYPLPITPLSHLVLTIEYYQATDQATVAEILSFINNVTVRHRGVSIHSLESEDLAALNLYLYGSGGFLYDLATTTSLWACYGLIVPFGRKMYDPDECFPATRRGEFEIVMDTTIPTTDLTNALMSISAISLPEATPSRHLKALLSSIPAPGATGPNDVVLPTGNDLLAVLMGMTSFPGASEYLFGADDLRLLFDYKELDIVSAKAPELLVEMINRIQATNRSTITQFHLIPSTYLWMDFDPTRDGEYAINTREAADLRLRLNMGVNEALNVTPVELVTL